MIGIDNSVFKYTVNKTTGKDCIISKLYSRKAINKDIVYIKNKEAVAILSLGVPERISYEKSLNYNLDRSFKQKTKKFYVYNIKSIFQFSAPLKINSKLDSGFYADIPTFNSFSSTNIEFVKPIKPFKDKVANVSNEFFCHLDMQHLKLSNMLCEKKYDGIRIQLHKDLNKVNAYTYFGNKIPNNKIQHILDDVKKFDSDILILDGELYSNTNDVYSIISDKSITTPELSLKVKVFDMLNLNGTYLTDKPLYERKTELDKSFDNTKNISKAKYIKLTDFESLEQIIKATDGRLIEGLVLKDCDSAYKQDDSKNWYKLIFPKYLLKNLNTEVDMLNEDILYELHYNLHRMARKFSEGKNVASWTTEKIIELHNKIAERINHKIKISKIDSLDAHINKDLIKTPSITSGLLKGYTDQQVIGTHFKLHVAFGNYLRHGIMSGRDMSELVNAHFRVLQEFENRGFKHQYQDALDDATLKFLGNMKPTDSVLPFIRETNLEFIRDIATYNPKNRKTIQLKDDWRFLSAWYTDVMNGQKIKYSLEELANLGLLVYKELTKRNIKFHPDKMKKYSKQFYNKIVSIHKGKTKLINFNYIKVNPSGKVDGYRIYMKDILPHLQGKIKLAEPFVYIVGGLANHEEEGTTGDIDILIKKEEPENPNEDRALKFRILRALPENIRPRVHFLYDQLHGPFTNFIQLWDLELVPNADCKLHNMSLVDNSELKWKLIDKDNNLASFTTAKFLVTPDEKKIPITSNLREDVLKVLEDNSVKMLLASDITDYTMECLGAIGVKWEMTDSNDLSKISFKLGRFHMMPKPTHGRSKEEIYSPLSVINVIKAKPEWEKELEENGLYIEKKYDGIRAQAHKSGDNVQIWTEEGNVITDKLPTLKEQFLKLDGDFEAEFEIELIKDGKHQPRAVTSGLINLKETSPDEKYLRAVVYDSLYFDGLDLSTEPYSKRLENMYKFKGKNIIHTDPIIAKDYDDVRNAISKKSKLPGSEGAMIKMPSHIYDFDGKTDKVLKYKNEISIFARVKKQNKVTGTEKTFYYDCVVGSPKDETYIGRTFNTNIDAKPGETIEVVTVEVSQYDDKGKTWFNWWSPRAIRHRGKEEVFSINRIKEIVKETTGLEQKKKMPKTAVALFDNSKIDLKNIFLDIPDENKTYKYVVHWHARGRSVHLDLRIQYSKDLLVGWTLFIPKGLTRDATSLADAKAIYNKDFKALIEDKFQNPLTKFTSKKKMPEPIEWIDAEGFVEKGEIGASKFEHGQFVIIDKGTVQYGAQKPNHHEYFFDGKLLNGKYLFTELENKAEWKKTPEGFFTWMGFPSQSPPYMLTPRSINRDYVPDKGIRAIPKKIAAKIPKEYQYWNYDERSKRKEVRADLIKAVRKQPFPIRKAMLIDYAESNVELYWYGTLGSGKKSDTHKLNTSSLLTSNNFKLRINAGIDYLDNIDNPDAIILTSLSSKHIGALKNRIDIPIYGSQEMKQAIEKLGYPNEIRSFEKYLKLADMNIEAFPVYHSNKCKTMALKIYTGPHTFVYAPDYLHTEDQERLFKGADVLILDATRVLKPDIRKIKEYSGHLDLKSNINNAIKYGIQNILLTNFSDESIKLENSLESWVEKVSQGKLIHMIANDNDAFGFSYEVNLKSLDYANSAKYILQHRYWKGQFVVRKGPSKQVYDLRIKEPGKDTYTHFILNYNPIDTEKTSGQFKEDNNFDMFKYSGELKPGHEENKTKNTPAWIRKLTDGTVTIIEDNPNVKQFKFTSGKLKGIFLATKRNGAWILERKESSPKTNAWTNHSFKINDLKKTDSNIWEAVGFAPGTWNGCSYPEDVVKNSPKPDGLNIVRDHSDEVVHQVGKILSSRWDKDLKAMIIKFMVTNDEVNRQLETKQIRGVSMRCFTNSYKDDNNREIATEIVGWGHGALVMEPACDICTIL